MDKKKGKPRNGSTDDGIPEAKYTRFGERIRQAIPGPVQCSVGCGGKNCKWENPSRWSDADQAIKGVFSSWVLDDVVAMSRPSTEIIKKYKMIEQFKKHNIRSIINLQRPGEHASCGPPLEKESLFTYRPQEFMDNDVFFYNFGWKDYGVTSMDTILDMVKVMSFALEEGKVAVHCHAGLGRTGVLIACYLVYAERMDPAAAILKVRQNRSNSIQTRGQIACINEFWHFLRPLRIIFPQVVPHARRLTLKQFLTRQSHLLHGFESRDLRHTPKLVHEICKRLCHIAHAHGASEIVDENPPRSPTERCSTVAEIKETLPKAFVNESMQQPSDVTDSVENSLEESPSNFEVVLPKLNRKDSARSVRSLDLHHVSGSACDAKRSLSGEAIFQSERIENVTDTSVEAKELIEVLSKLAVSNDDETRSQDDDKASNNRNKNQPNALESLDSIPDEQIERDVNEILGCNTNNNHSLHNRSSKSPSSTVASNRAKRSSTSSDTEADKLDDSAVLIERGSPAENADQSAIPQASIRKIRRSAVHSETLLPTGLPIKNPRSSAKGKPSSVSDRDVVTTHSNSSKEAAEPVNLTENAGDESKTTSGVPQGQTLGTLLASSAAEVSAKVLSANEDPLSSNKSGDVIALISSKMALKSKPMYQVPDLNTASFDKGLNSNDSGSDDETLADKSSREDTCERAAPDIIMSSVSFEKISDVADTQSPVFAQPDDVTKTRSVSVEGCENSETCQLSPPDIALVDGAESPKETALESPKIDFQEHSDDDLDEIIDIPNGDDQRSMDGDNITQIESADGVDALSRSVASRVSWSQLQEKGAVKDDAQRKASASSVKTDRSGRRTPLMYRAEKNMMLLSGEKPVGDDVASKLSSNGENHRGSDASEEDVGNGSTSEQDECTADASQTGAEMDAHRPESTLKLPVLSRINTARSLNDLASPFHVDPPVTFSRCSSSGDMRHPSPHGHQSASERINPTNVALAFSYKLIDDEWLWEKVYSLQVEINNHKDAWKTLAEVTDAYLLASLMWSWVERLAEPILRERDSLQMLSIINKSSPSSSPSHIVDRFEKALGSLEPSTSCTVKCLLNTVTSFPALVRRISESMIERILSATTHSPMPPAEKSKTNADLTQAFQDYVSAKYKVTNRRRFIDDMKQTTSRDIPNDVARLPSTESEYSDCDEVVNDTFPIATEVSEALRKSAGSVHSSGSSNTSMSAQRIVVK